MPRRTRKPAVIPRLPGDSGVSSTASDHPAIVPAIVRRGPRRSAIQPPIGCMTRYPSENALSIVPMVEGDQVNCFDHTAVATLKLLRSAHNSTLPRKNTVAHSDQLIGRAARAGARLMLALMVVLPSCGLLPAIAPIVNLASAAVKPSLTPHGQRRGAH